MFEICSKCILKAMVLEFSLKLAEPTLSLGVRIKLSLILARDWPDYNQAKLEERLASTAQSVTSKVQNRYTSNKLETY